MRRSTIAIAVVIGANLVCGCEKTPTKFEQVEELAPVEFAPKQKEAPAPEEEEGAASSGAATEGASACGTPDCEKACAAHPDRAAECAQAFRDGCFTSKRDADKCGDFGETIEGEGSKGQAKPRRLKEEDRREQKPRPGNIRPPAPHDDSDTDDVLDIFPHEASSGRSIDLPANEAQGGEDEPDDGDGDGERQGKGPGIVGPPIHN
jgi:hypothetical protein